MELLTPNGASDLTTVRKLGWHGWIDKLMKGQRSKQKQPDVSALKPNLDHNVALEKLLIKRRDKATTFQTTFDKQAMDALEDSWLQLVTKRMLHHQVRMPKLNYPSLMHVYILVVM